jgi:hypothetical protein
MKERKDMHELLYTKMRLRFYYIKNPETLTASGLSSDRIVIEYYSPYTRISVAIVP